MKYYEYRTLIQRKEWAMTYLLTPGSFNRLKELIVSAEAELQRASSEGSQSGGDQDGHHDEGYQLSLRETAVNDKRLADLQAILNDSEIVDPIEQDEVVLIGNGVVVTLSGGRRVKGIVDGCVIEHTQETMISSNSPLGRAIVGAKKSEEITYKNGKEFRHVKVEKIFPPSKAKEVYLEPD